MAATIKGINVVIGAETTGLQKALSDVNKKSKDIQSELRQVERALKFNPNDTVLLAQKQKLLGDQVANTREKLDRLKAAQAQVNEQFRRGEISEGQYRAFQREIVETESKLKHFEKQLASTQKNLVNFGKSMQDAGKKMTDTGKNLSMKVTAPIVGLGAVIAKTGVEFEAAMSEVGAISGATGADLQALEDIAKEMGSTTKFSASEAASGLKYMAMAGWDTQQMLDGLPGVLNLAAAAGEDLGLVSDIVTDAMTAFSMEAKQAGEFADTLAAASSSANTNVAMLGESFKYVAPVAGALGFSAKDTSIALSLMANAGIKGSQSGTALRTMMTNLAKPTDQMQKAMTEYGISLTNTDGSMKSLDQVMLNLRESLGGLTEAEQAAAAATIFGKEAMSGALAIVNTSEADFNKLSDAINNSAGAANRMAEEMQDNLQGRLTALKSAIERVALQLYDAMKPALEAVVAVVQKIVDWIAKLSPEMQTAIVIIAGLAAAVGPLLIVLGLMASGLGSILTILPALGAAFAIVTGPIGIAVAAIAALVAMLVHLYRTNEDVRANMQVVWNGIKAVIDAVMPAILYVIETVWNNIKGVISGALNVIQGLIAVFAGVLTGDFKGLWEGIKQIFSGAFEFLFNLVQLMFVGKILAIFKNFAKLGIKLLRDTGSNLVRGLWDGIKSRGRWLTDQISRFVKDNVVGTVKRFLGIASPSKVFAAIGREIVTGMGDGINSRSGYAVDQIKKLGDKILNTGDHISTGMIRIDEKTGQKIYDNTYKNVMKRIDLYYKDRDRRVALMTRATDENIKQLQKEIDATQKATDIKIKLYEQEYRAKHKLIDDESDERVKALYTEIDAIDKLREQEEREKEEEEYQSRITGLWAQYEDALESEGDTGSILDEIHQVESDRRQKLLEQERRDRQEQLREEIELERERAAEKKRQLEEELEEKKYNLEQQRIAELEHMNQVLALMQEQVKLTEELEKVQTDIKAKEKDLQTRKMDDETKKQTEVDLDELKEREKNLQKTIATNQTNLEAFTPKLQQISNRYGQVMLAGFKSTEGQIKSYISGLISYMQEQLAGAGIGGAMTTDGYHARGLAYVPYDDYRAILHEGERVLTKSENKVYTETRNKGSGDVYVTQHIYSPSPDPRTEQRRAAREFKKLALGV